MKKSIILLSFVLLSSSIFAQKAELTSAILSFRKQDMESAKSYVDAAEVKLNNGGTLKVKDLGKFWHHKGLVYYSLYDASKALWFSPVSMHLKSHCYYCINTNTCMLK